MSADLKDHELGPVADILKLRQDQNTDELSASEPSDGGFDAQNIVTLYRFPSHSKNAHHIPNELLPTITACSRTKMVQIDELVAVPVTDEELATVDAKGRFVQDETRKPLCLACVWARPDRFPDSVLVAIANTRKPR